MADSPFKSHMSSDTASQLKVNDMVDYRTSTGQFRLVKITMKSASNLKIFCNGWAEWCDYSTELYRFANAESISKRPAHQFNDLVVGDYIDINPIYQQHPGWKPAEIRQIDQQSGQVQVVYECNNMNLIHWAHLDDTNEVSAIATKSAVVAEDAQNTESQMLEEALQKSMDTHNNVNADDVNSELQKVLQLSIVDTHIFESVAVQQSIESHSVEEKKDNDSLQEQISDTFVYNKDVVDQLVNLGFERNECIQASSMVIDYNDINRVADQVQLIKEPLVQQMQPIGNLENKEEKEVESAPRPNNKMKVFMNELEELIGIIQKRLDFMNQQDSVVEMLIDSSTSQSLLQSAKTKALRTEKRLLEQIMNLHEINTFLNNIILVENLFNSQYGEQQRQEQQNARRMFARNIVEYENKPKPVSEMDSFIELIFAGTNLHIGEFRSWLQMLSAHCSKAFGFLNQCGGAKGKNIERAFYKAFYVYGMKSNDGFKQLTDVLRCSLLFENFNDLYKCWAMIERLARRRGSVGILRCKDRFNAKEMPFGYRDLLVNIYCPGTKVVCEIQLHHKLFYQYKTISHMVYKKARLFEQDGVNLAYNYADKHNRKHVGKKVYEIKDVNEVQSGGGLAEAVKLLKEWELDQYSGKLIQELGYEDVAVWQDLTLHDLQSMGFKEGQAKKFVRQVTQYWQAQSM